MVWSLIARLTAGLVSFSVLTISYQLFWPAKKRSYKGQHVIVTGASQGMGKSIAKEFIKRGAHVSIIARTQKTLDQAQTELQACTIFEGQRVQARSVDCSDAEAVAAGIAALGTPDVLFCCAGKLSHNLVSIY
jgi:3-dehydrosphinganine reductase